MKIRVESSEAPKPVGPYSQAVQVGNTLYLSGQIGIDPSTGKLVEGFKEQVSQCLHNVDAVLRAAGFDKDNVVKVVVYITDMDRFGELNAVYEEFFKDVGIKPARVAVGVKSLPLGALVELEVVAVKLS